MPEDKVTEPSGEATSADAGLSATDPEPNVKPCNTGSEPGSGTEPDPEPAGHSLPPLTPHEFRIYNRLAEQMEYFHDHFRQTFTALHAACAANRRPAGMSLRQFLDEGLRLARYLEAHHAIEETHLYPLLARRMPEFRAAGAGADKSIKSKGKSKGEEGNCELLRQHRAIHAGMDEFAGYLRRCKNRECELELAVLKEKMDSWGEVLMRHLDEEVRALGAERMRRYWSLAEMRAFPI
ncbi:hypothetical protein VTK56DRAFT_8511 [Thermocarpiscus australiensis]